MDEKLYVIATRLTSAIGRAEAEGNSEMVRHLLRAKIEIDQARMLRAGFAAQAEERHAWAS